MSKRIDINDQRFGKLLVLSFNGVDKYKNAMWLCICDCGNKKSVRGSSLRNNVTKSCGCLMVEKAQERCGEKSYWYGKKHTEKTKERMSINHADVSGENNPNYGKTASEETKLKQSIVAKNRSVETINKMSEAKKGKYNGKNNPNYNPNLTDEDRQDRRLISGLKRWRCAVYKRDNYTCQICGKDGGFEAHHINGWNLFPEQRLVVSNGITLCISCHHNFHNKYGRGNNTIEQLEEYVSCQQ